MDLSWTSEQAQFRAAVANVLDDVVDPDAGLRRAGVEHSREASLRICRRLAAQGQLVPHWPIAWGGSDSGPWHQHILAEEMWRRGEPRAPQYLNINFIGPAIMAFGSEAQKNEHLPRIARGDALWCQGFSEPDAGSDLSRIRTRARKVAGGYLVSGAKEWISYADVAEFCFLLAGLADTGDAALPGGRPARVVLLVPMSSPGLSVSEISSIIGPHVFHSIVLDDVFVPADCLLGQEGRGWDVVRHALANERIGAPEYVQAERVLDHAVQRVAETGRELSQHARAQLGMAYARCAAARLLTYRAVDEGAHGQAGTNSAFVARAFQRTARQACADAIATMLSETDGQGLREADIEALNAIIAGVAGGAYEVLLDLVAVELVGPRGA